MSTLWIFDWITCAYKYDFVVNILFDLFYQTFWLFYALMCTIYRDFILIWFISFNQNVMRLAKLMCTICVIHVLFFKWCDALVIVKLKWSKNVIPFCHYVQMIVNLKLMFMFFYVHPDHKIYRSLSTVWNKCKCHRPFSSKSNKIWLLIDSFPTDIVMVYLFFFFLYLYLYLIHLRSRTILK